MFFRESPSAYLKTHRPPLPGLADPSGAWSPAASRALCAAIRPLFESRYFRSEVRGAENLPDGPMLLVGVHGGGIVSPDLLLLGLAFYERFAFGRPLYGLAHRLLFWVPYGSKFLAAIGGVEGTPENAVRILREGEALAVFPGGEYDVARPFRRRNEVDFHGRTGFVRVALAARVPIVPVGAIGGQATWIVLSDGRRLARAVHAERVFGLHRLPLSIDLPWGVSVGYVPFWPFPAHVGVAFGAPMWFAPTPGERGDRGYHAFVRDCVEAEVRRLAASLLPGKA